MALITVKMACAFALSVVVSVNAPLEGCTRIFYNSDPELLLCGRSLDWHCPLGEEIWLLPRGIECCDSHGRDSHQWRSLYGSLLLVAKNYQDAPIEGINEKGLAAHALYFGDARYEERGGRPAVSHLLWVRYLLDNFATVAEAVALSSQVWIAPKVCNGELIPLHIALEDGHGDSAIIEFVDGKREVYWGKKYTVMTNDPPYSDHLDNLLQYRHSAQLGTVPRGNGAKERFVRASLNLEWVFMNVAHLRRSAAVALLFQLIDNVSTFCGTIAVANGESSHTWWSSVVDLTERYYYYNAYSKPSILWVDLKALDFDSTAIPKILNPNEPHLSGEVTGQFIVPLEGVYKVNEG